METNLADLFESVADAMPEQLAVVAGDQRLALRQLDERANRFAHALAARGVRAGEHVGLCLYNGVEFLECFLGAFKLRAVPINLNYRYTGDELALVVEDAELAALVYERELAPRVSAAQRAGTPRTLITVGRGEGAGVDGALEYEELLAAASPDRGFGPRSGDDLCIVYTGGTTGTPRGVMWRHEDLLFAGLQGGNPGGVPIQRPEELARIALARRGAMVLLPAAPLIHGTAQWASLIALFSGGTVVLAPGRSYDPHRVCRLIEAERVNTLVLIGDAMARPLAEALARPESPPDLSSLRVISSSGAFLSKAVRAQLQRALPEAVILDNFGATESGHQGTACPQEGGSTFYMDESSAVLTDDLRPIAPGSGEIGRLARRGRLPLGYYKDAQRTAATFPVINGVRWVIPGDFATLEADGRITVLGRGAVCINTGGEKVFPEEVEAVLKAHPAVLDAVVVGVPDERWGEQITAVVAPRLGHAVELEELAAHCRGSLSGYKVPRQLRVVPSVVRHPSGKPDYRWASRIARESPDAAARSTPEELDVHRLHP